MKMNHINYKQNETKWNKTKQKTHHHLIEKLPKLGTNLDTDEKNTSSHIFPVILDWTYTCFFSMVSYVFFYELFV